MEFSNLDQETFMGQYTEIEAKIEEAKNKNQQSQKRPSNRLKFNFIINIYTFNADFA